MRTLLIVLGVVVVIVLLYIFVIKPKSDAAAASAGAAAGSAAVSSPTSAYIPGTSQAALASAAHPFVCRTRCSYFHPFSQSKRLACEQKCKQTGVVS